MSKCANLHACLTVLDYGCSGFARPCLPLYLFVLVLIDLCGLWLTCRVPVTPLTSRAPPRQILCFGWFFNCSGVRPRVTMDHLWSVLPPSRVQKLIYSPPQPFAPIYAHYGHIWTSFPLWCTHAMFNSF